MYKVTIQATPFQADNWKVVATGTWTPGTPPQLDSIVVPADVVTALLNITPAPADRSGRNQVDHGDTSYAVVFRRLSR
jgi:hypothetical protein